jgi:hypothetical protein
VLPKTLVREAEAAGFGAAPPVTAHWPCRQLSRDTGFACALPTGEGILNFSTVDQGRNAIESVVADPQRHAQAARDIVYEYFDSSKVLNRLIAQAA